MAPVEFSQSLRRIRMSPIISISEDVRARAPEFEQKNGKKFVLFQRGEIDLPTPDYIVEAAKQALNEGHTKYPKSGGEPVLKRAIVDKLERQNGAKGIGPDNVVCTYGGQGALELTFKLFEGKRCAAFAPCWSCVLENFVPYCGTDLVQVPLREDFSIDFSILEQTLAEVDFLYLNTPQNPSGKVYSEADIRKIVSLCERHGVYVISDEAYERIVYDGIRYFSPLACHSPWVIGTYTFSKAYSMTGWRLGYLVTRNPEIARLIRLGDYTQTAGVVTFLQHAAAAAYNNVAAEEAAAQAMLAEFTRRRNALCDGLAQIPGVKVTRPEGALYVFPNFSALIPSDVSAQQRPYYVHELLMGAGIAGVYGPAFGGHFSENIRLSFSATPVSVIDNAVGRMKHVLGGSPADAGPSRTKRQSRRARSGQTVRLAG